MPSAARLRRSAIITAILGDHMGNLGKTRTAIVGMQIGVAEMRSRLKKRFR
jgi:hypothetical protein